MQNAKDTFYIALRDRLAALNPERAMTLRGVVRPGILVEEAEAPSAQLPLDAFVLRWTTLKADSQMPSALAAMTCEIHYATSGTRDNLGLDRGRALEVMDHELLRMLSPASAVKMNYAQSPAAQMGTNIFWSQPVFAAEATTRERVGRVATVEVFAFQEQGEL
jgi:hypothetical protein